MQADLLAFRFKYVDPYLAAHPEVAAAAAEVFAADAATVTTTTAPAGESLAQGRRALIGAIEVGMDGRQFGFAALTCAMRLEILANLQYRSNSGGAFAELGQLRNNQGSDDHSEAAEQQLSEARGHQKTALLVMRQQAGEEQFAEFVQPMLKENFPSLAAAFECLQTSKATKTD
jgi:hypothetical protein